MRLRPRLASTHKPLTSIVGPAANQSNPHTAYSPPIDDHFPTIRCPSAAIKMPNNSMGLASTTIPAARMNFRIWEQLTLSHQYYKTGSPHAMLDRSS
jgi:hypothetical protein